MTTRAYYAEMGKRLRSIRKARKLTQVQMGIRAGVSVNVIHVAEKYGAISLDADRLALLAGALGLTVDQLAADDWRVRCERDGISLEEAK